MSAHLPDLLAAAPSGPSRFDFATVSGRDTGAGGSIAVTVPDRALLLADLDRRLRAGQGFSLATLNLDHLVKIGRDPAFARAYAAQTHVTADGNPIVWLCAMAGQEVELIPGSELVDPVAGLAAEAGVPVALLGSTDAALAAAGAALVARHPDLRIAARIAPPMGFDPGRAQRRRLPLPSSAPRARVCVSWRSARPSRRYSLPMPKTRCPGWVSCRSARVSISWPDRRPVHQRSCVDWRLNGSGG
jgi:hypothetical protein